MFSIDHILFYISLLIVISIFITKLSENFGLPALLLFLAVGMLAGSDGIGKIFFEDVNITQAVGTVALILILFSGGLSTNISSVYPVRKEAISLATIGVVITALLVGLFCRYVLGFDLIYGMLLGAIVSSTDAAAVFSILRSNNINLKNKLKPLLELESGCNDPMAIFLTVTLTAVIVSSEVNILSISFSLIKQFAFGSLIGYFVSKLLVNIFNRISLSYEGLYPVLALSFAFLIYGSTALIGGSGYLAVYIAGIIIGNSNIIQKRSMMRFFDGLAWLGQIGMFLTLGLLVYPSQLLLILGTGITLSLFLIFAARPLSVLLSLYFSGFRLNEKLAVSWIGLRGAVPIILATIPLSSGIDNSHRIFNIVFFIVITSAIIQGWTIKYITKFFKVSAKPETDINSPIEFQSLDNNSSELLDFIVPYNSGMNNKTIIDLNLPKDCLIIFICRNEKFFVPNGNTVLNEGDVLQILMNKEDMSKVIEMLK